MTREITFKEYWESLNAKGKRAFAANCKTSVPTLSQAAHGHKKIGHRLGAKITNAYPEWPMERLRPDLFEG